MKHLAWTLFAILALAGCEPKKLSVSAISPMEAAGMQRNGFAVILDVREEDEVRYSGLAQGAKWIPTSRIQVDAPEWRALLSSVGKDQKLAIYCAGGMRAQKAAELAAAAGVSAVNLGGFSDWKKAGLPVVKDLPGAAPAQK